MAKQAVVALTLDGVWLCGKIGTRLFALKYTDSVYGPVVHLEPSQYFPKGAFEKGIRGWALIRHRLGSGHLAPQDKRTLNALLSFAAKIPDQYALGVISEELQVFMAEVDDEKEEWTLDLS